MGLDRLSRAKFVLAANVYTGVTAGYIKKIAASKLKGADDKGLGKAVEQLTKDLRKSEVTAYDLERILIMETGDFNQQLTNRHLALQKAAGKYLAALQSVEPSREKAHTVAENIFRDEFSKAMREWCERLQRIDTRGLVNEALRLLAALPSAQTEGGTPDLLP